VQYRRHDSNETHRFPGPSELEHGLLARRRVLANSDRTDAERERLLGAASENGRLEAVTRAREAVAQGNRATALEYLAVAMRIPELLQQPPTDQSAWLTQVLQEWLVGVPAGGGMYGNGEEFPGAAARARAEVVALRRSLSWRATAPLRSVYDLWLRLARSGQ
jgi:hypothetical protein